MTKKDIVLPSKKYSDENISFIVSFMMASLNNKFVKNDINNNNFVYYGKRRMDLNWFYSMNEKVGVEYPSVLPNEGEC